MPEYILTAEPPLGGYERHFEGTSLREHRELAIVAVSIPLGKDTAVSAALGEAYGATLPDHGVSVVSEDGATRILRFTADQIFLLFTHAKPDAAQVVSERLNGTGYTVDQTDNWVSLSLSGSLARPALERICAVNLRKDAFAIGRAERTVMEHLGAIIIRTGDDGFLLMSGSSSAESFLHALETSVKYVS
ncbi:MAG: sarcosine oxidase subunit gamma [Rhodobacteraceae bacterium]|nr:sarcosine oxidase subunit gamma [Paracoccaceae bacterium]